MSEDDPQDSGLTLVELLATLALIAVIATLAFTILDTVLGSSQAHIKAATAAEILTFKKEWSVEGHSVAEIPGALIAYEDVNRNGQFDPDTDTSFARLRIGPN